MIAPEGAMRTQIRGPCAAPATEIVLPGEGFADVLVASDDPPDSWSSEHDAATRRLTLTVDHALAQHTFRIAPQ